MLKEKTIEIDWNGKKELVTFRKPTLGERNDLKKSCRSVKVVDGQVSMDIDDGKLQELAMKTFITMAPFGTKLEEIRELDATLADEVYEEMNDFVAGDAGKKRNGSDSGGKSQTRTGKSQSEPEMKT